jgi:hypothetical protein
MKYRAAVAAAALVVFMASFLPWATLTATARPLPERLTGDPLGMEFTVNAWNGDVRYSEFVLPNWFVVVAAVGAAVAYWAKPAGQPSAVGTVAVGLALAGLVHVLCFLAILFRSRGGQAGWGSALTVLGMLSLLALALFPARRPKGLF